VIEKVKQESKQKLVLDELQNDPDIPERFVCGLT
jgi:hypothetical protein